MELGCEAATYQRSQVREKAGGPAPRVAATVLRYASPPGISELYPHRLGQRSSRPREEQVGWVKLQILLLILKVIVKPGPFCVLIPARPSGQPCARFADFCT